MTATLHLLPSARHPSTGCSSQELIGRAHITYRQLDYWVRTGRLVPQDDASGSGFYRAFPPLEVTVACLMGRLVASGLTPQAAHDMARDLANTGTTTIAGITIHLPVEP